MTLKVKNVPIDRWWDVWIAILALAAVFLMAARLSATEWSEGLHLLVYLTIIAGLTGLFLGYSRFHPLIAMLFSAIYGIFTGGWLLGTTIDLDVTWRERIVDHLVWRLRISIEQFVSGQQVTNPILFLTLMAVLLWILASTATFILIRQGADWPAMIPLGVTVLVIGHYDPDLTRNSFHLMAFLFMTLLIVGRMTFLRYRHKWNKEGVHTNTETQLNNAKALLFLAIFLIALAWFIPITTRQHAPYTQWWDSITRSWERFTDRFADIFEFESTTSTATSGFFDNSMDLGTGTPISEDIVFLAQVDTPPPAGYRHYWRARVYDVFDGAEWSTSPGLQKTRLDPNDFDIRHPDWVDLQPARYTITPYLDRMANVYAPGLPTWTNRPVDAFTRPLSASEEEFIAMVAEPLLFRGDSYQVETLVSQPDARSLRRSGNDYPEWLNRYRQVPEDFSPAIAGLASILTAGHNNPYDKAASITRYLRTNIEYARTIDPVPPGQDPIEWFLFDYRMGFCNYYATAQVLMLRSLGIPARLAVGYAQGEYDRETNVFTVQRRHSHAWPEVYFNDYGWVIFEPTGSEPVLVHTADTILLGHESFMDLREDRPIMDFELETPDGMTEFGDGFTGQSNQPGTVAVDPEEGNPVTGVMLVIVLSGLAIIIGIVLFRPSYIKMNIDPIPVALERTLSRKGLIVPGWLQRWSRRARMSDPERAYRQLGWSIMVLGHALNKAETPAERVETLANLLPEARQPAADIIREYQIDRYSNHTINRSFAMKSAQDLFRIALKARLRRILPF